MSLEIERKFLVDTSKLPKLENGKKMIQGYLQQRSPSIRIRVQDDAAFLTIKGDAKNNITRTEFEYNIPIEDAKELLKECKGLLISKTRYEILHKGHLWELDIFENENSGLIVAEIELEDENEEFVLPEWVTTEVSSDPRYTNASLSELPYSQW
ncbi:MAG: CYTH domain-containing protein [Sulfurovaceae bacterium]|jgi:adenylate cyclase|nr:CYTH domain-containing protein [Sulfurovaceae bacterium]